MKNLALLPALALALAVCSEATILSESASAQEANTQQDDSAITIGERFSIASEVLDEERDYWVYLPASYNSSIYAPQSYPVLYLLDGNAHFHSASGVVQFMSSGINSNVQIPGLIVVAIPNTDRTRDLSPTHSTTGWDGKEDPSLESSGGGDTFLRFISEELSPEIDSTYRTLPYRILVGHSLGGLLALHALLDTPQMFQAYIAIDPSLWWDDQVLVRRIASRLDEDAQGLRGSAYISLANHSADGVFGVEDMEVEEAVSTFAELLESAASPSLRPTLQYFEAEDHGSVPLLSLYYGLLHTFEGYKPPPALFVEQPSDLNSYFENISERLGVTLLPPEAAVNEWGYYMLYGEEDVDKAIELFKLNVSNYPGSFNVYDSLGEAYMVKDDKPLAIEFYEKSLELDPTNENANEQLEVLRGQEEQE